MGKSRTVPLKEEHGLKFLLALIVFETWVLRRIFRMKREEVTGKCCR
jgi:flagellar biogenesis protein FliO